MTAGVAGRVALGALVGAAVGGGLVWSLRGEAHRQDVAAIGTSFEQVGTFAGGEARLRAAEADLARRTKELEDARSNDEAREESCWQCQQDVARNKKDLGLLMSHLEECDEAIVRCLEDRDETRAGQGKSAGKRSR